MSSKSLTRIAALALGLAMTLVLDRALGWAGLPPRPVAYPVAPPNYETTFERLEYSYTIRTNDRGIRYRTIPMAKPVGTHRVVLLGDSFTEGACVEAHERWSDLVEERAATGEELELVNCGEAGTHPPDYLRTLLDVGLEYDPDVVLVGIYFDDFAQTPAAFDPERVTRDWRRGGAGVLGAVGRVWPHLVTLLVHATPPKTRRPEKPGRWDLVAAARNAATASGLDEEEFEHWRQVVPDEKIAAAEARLIPPGLMTQALTRPDFFYTGIGVESENALRRAAAVRRTLDTMHAVCAEHGARFGVILMPSVHQYDSQSSRRLMATLFAALGHPVREEWKTELTGMERELQAWADESDVPFCNLVPTFREAVQGAEEPLNFEIDPHWTPAGHRVAADAIESWMMTAGLLP